jgi:hypothetical protein
MENLGKFVTVVLAVIVSAIIRGFIFSKLWLWFIVPIFQMQPLRVVEAIGIMSLIEFFLIKKDKNNNEEKFWETLLSSMLFVMITSGFTLLFGWIVTLFL